MLTRLSVLAAALVLASCAAAVPGYTPPSFKESANKKKFGTPSESGGLGSDGRYEMSEAEKALDCKRLTGSMQITIARLKDSYGLTEPSWLASSSQKVFAPLFGGSTVGSDRQAEFARERAKLDAYNSHLTEKGCKTVDIDAELARQPEAPKKY